MKSSRIDKFKAAYFSLATEFFGSARMPDKNNTNFATTPLFPCFWANSRLKYVQYVCARLYQKSSKLSAFWLRASLTAYYFVRHNVRTVKTFLQPSLFLFSVKSINFTYIKAVAVATATALSSCLQGFSFSPALWTKSIVPFK